MRGLWYMVFVIFDYVICIYFGVVKFSVDNFCLDIYDGEFLVFVGFFGCGKFIMLCMLVGFEFVDFGSIFIGDKDVIMMDLKIVILLWCFKIMFFICI